MAVPWVVNVATAPLGTPRANAFRVAVMARFPGQLVSWGTYSCRRQSIGPYWSAHAWGNADDIHPISPAVGDKAVAWANLNKRAFGIDYVLWRGAAGHFPGHFHVQFLPNMESGGATPPCKGGPSVTLSGGAVVPAGGGRRLGTVPETSPGRCPPGYSSIGKGMCLPTPGLNLTTTQGAAADVLGRIFGVGDIGEKVFGVAKIAAGGVVMLAGLAVVVMAGTGVAPVPGVGKAVNAVGPARRAAGRQRAVRDRVRSVERSEATREAGTRVRTSGGKTYVVRRKQAAADADRDDAIIEQRKGERAAKSRERLRGRGGSRSPRVKVRA